MIFENRSSRVIAAARVALALLFGLWVWIDPQQPVRGGAVGYVLFTAYVAYAAALFPIAWYDWWVDFRLTVPTFLLDGAIFLAGFYYTVGGPSDFFGAYFAFMIFILLSAALRWRWRATLLAAAVLGLLYIATGALLQEGGLDAFPYKFVRRASYLAVLSLVFTWFALRHGAPEVKTLPPARSPDARSPYARALAHAMAETRARGGALAWERGEEPGSTLQTAGALGEDLRHVAPRDLDLGADAEPMLFDAPRKRMLASTEGGIAARHAAPGAGLAGHLGLSEGLSLPLEGATGRGQLVLTGIPGLCRDHLELGAALAREIAHALDEEEMAAIARDAAAMRMRGNLARDLHDSVAQSLAGAGFRIEALRQLVRGGGDLMPEIDAIGQSIQAEQAHVRSVIEGLRGGEAQPGGRDLAVELDGMLHGLAAHWKVDIRFEHGVDPIMVPVWLLFEIQQLVREGVANAVRHGSAKTVSVRAELAAEGLTMFIADDGTGFAGPPDEAMPRSIAERAAALGGSVAVSSIGGDTRIEINLPLKGGS